MKSSVTIGLYTPKHLSQNMKNPFKNLTVITGLSLGLTTAAFGQLQWSSYDTSGNLVTSNVATGGDLTSGGNVTFTIPANTQLSFATKSFTPFSIAGASTKKIVTFNVSVSGGLTGVAQRTMGWGLYNSAGTATFTDDVGYFGLYNGGGPYIECYDHPAGAANLLSGTALGQGTVNVGTPTDGTTYTNQIQLDMNSSANGISLGTSSSTLATAGLAMNGVNTTNRVYTNPVGGPLGAATSFDEFVFMFNNTTGSPVTATLSAVALGNSLTWDASGANPTAPTDGAGNWSTTNANWSSGATDSGWTSGYSAVIGANNGTSGTITITEPAGVTVSNITYNTNYTVSGSPLTYTGSPTITVASGSTATNTGIISGTGFTKTGAGTLRLAGSAANTFNSLVTINAGTLTAASGNNSTTISSDLLVNSNGTFLYSQNSMIDPTKTLIVNGGLVTNITASTVLTVNKLVLDNNGQIMDASGNSYANATNYDLRSGNIFSSRYRIGGMLTYKSTSGTVIISNRPNTSATDGHVVTMNGGTLMFDKSLINSARLLPNGGLTLGGGTLIFTNGNSAIAPTTENPGTTNTTIKPGASYVLSTNVGASGGSITFGALVRQVGGTFDFYKLSSGTSSTTSANVNGIEGGWATWNSTDWLIGTTLAPYTAYTVTTAPSGWVAANNVSLSGNPSANADDTTINSLRLTAASTVTMNATKTLTLTTGGLLTTGSGATSITGGNLKSGTATSDLVIHQYASADLTISSTLTDNSTTSLTKSGSGKLVINGVNNLTGTNFINGGVLEVSNLTQLASGPLFMNAGTLRYTGTNVTETRTVTFNGLGGTFDVPTGTTLTMGSAIKGSGAPIGDLGGLTKIGAGTLVLNASNYFNGATVVSNGVLSINGTNAYDKTTFLAGNLFVYGGVLGGSGIVPGPVFVKNGGTIAPGNSIGTLTLATNLTLESGSTNLFEVTNGAAGDLLVVQGNLTIGANSTIAISVLGSALQATTNVLITYTGTKTGSFNPTVVVAGGTLNCSISIDESTPGQIKLVAVPQVVITGQPGDLTVSTNAPATFSVTATGAAQLYYQWYRYADINRTSPVAQTDATNATFTIASAQSSDSGFYGVVVTNASNSVTSRVATLIVGDVCTVLDGPTNQTVIQGNNATFSTKVSLANPYPTFQWQTNGIDVPGATSSNLTLVSVQYAALNNATVSVIASNRACLTTNSAILTIIVAPVITPQPTNLTVAVGDTAVFVSGATGVATPGLQWYKNNVAISGQTGNTLTIANAQGSDVASYKMVATNNAGSATSSVVTLSVISTNLTNLTVAPANGATGICYDTPLYFTFNSAISIVNTGKIRIYNSTNTVTPVDTIDMGANSVVVSSGIGLVNNIQPHSLFSGDSQVINYFPVIITGNTAAIYPHSGVMTSNQTYYVTMDNGVVKDSAGAYFAGISDTNAWRFTTKPTGAANVTNLVVAADGSGDFDTVQGAVDSIPVNNSNYTLVNIRNGNYVEIVDITGKNNITFRGQSRAGAVVGYANNNNLTGTTAGRMAIKVNASDIKFENLTLTNGTPQGGSQAECLLVYNSGLRCVVENCDIVSRQDTILINANTSQAYLHNCKIVGNFDYVWGSGVGYFYKCTFHTITNTLSGSYNLTAARTQTAASLSTNTPWVNPNGTLFSAYGFTFVRCTMEADSGVTGITLAGSNGTAGGEDDFIQCCIDTNAYVSPSITLSNTYVFWQCSNNDITCANPVTYSNVQTIGITNNDPRLMAATNVVTWFSGWNPALAPNILTQPVSLSVAGGASASFTVVATGIPDPTYQWFKNGSSIGGATSATYTIPAAYAGDVASYYAVVTTSAGSVQSSTATLAVGNTAPTAGSVTNVTVNVGVAVSQSDVATDPDVPTQTLSYSLAAGPSGAAVNASTGLVTWRPGVADAGSVNTITVVASDNGTPSLSATNSFAVTVNPLTVPTLGTASYGSGQFSLTVSGQSGPDYAVQVSTDVTSGSWTTLLRTNSPAMPFTFTDTNATNAQQFYRVVVGPPLP